MWYNIRILRMGGGVIAVAPPPMDIHNGTSVPEAYDVNVTLRFMPEAKHYPDASFSFHDSFLIVKQWPAGAQTCTVFNLSDIRSVERVLRG